VVLIELGIYSLVIYALLRLVGDFSELQFVFVSLSVGCLLVLLINPINNQIKKRIKRLFFGVDVDSSELLREHSRQISSAMDLKLLSKVVVELVEDWIDVDRGSLYTVDLELGENADRRYRIIEVPGNDGENYPSGLIPIDSPLTIKFGQQKSTLTIAEIKTMPIYLGLLGEERVWLERQQMELFIPIHAKDEWIGLLAIGPKRNGMFFTRADIILLETLVDQTAVALQNARLVDSLVRLNNEFRRAYSAMEDAHKKLERLSRTKSDFISISSHELRTPLTVLSGYSQILLEDSKIVENDYYKKVILGIYEGTNRLHEIVDSMLEVAKIDTHDLELQAKPVTLYQMVKRVRSDFDDVLSERSLEISIVSMENLPPIVGDEDALSKVFYHILSNAVKYTPDGGKIVIAGSKLEPGDLKFPSGGVEVIVSDTGIGIDPRYIDLIFTKFYQTGELALHSSGKTKFKGGGPGLGLAIVRGIVQAHGGLVWAESPEYDEVKLPGSDFHLILPLYLNADND
jgi:signal transduction histidine kinase